MKDLDKRVSPVHDKTNALTKSYHQWFPAQELHNQASRYSSKDEAGTHKLPLPSVKLLTDGGC